MIPKNTEKAPNTTSTPTNSQQQPKTKEIKSPIIQEMQKSAFSIEKALDLFVQQNNRMTSPLNTEYEFLKWLDEGRMIVVGGGSGLGKTAYTLQMLYNLVAENQSEKEEDSVIGIYASSEMMIEELVMRLIVNQEAIEGVNIANIRKKFNSRLVDPEEMKENIEKAKFILGKLPFFFLNASRFNLHNIIEMLKETRKNNPKKRIFIVIDYLQLLLLDATSLQEQNQTIKALKDALVDYRANAILISALNRDSIKNDFVEMSAFKDSSMIEYTTDIGILFAFKTEKGKYTLKMNEEDLMKPKITFYTKCIKNRIGSMFSTKVEFDKLQQKFSFYQKTKNDTDTIIENKGTKTVQEKKETWEMF